MAPEVFRDASLPRTVKYDVYSFGILLWELLSGEKPFEAGKCCLHYIVHLLTLVVLDMMLDRHLRKLFSIWITNIQNTQK